MADVKKLTLAIALIEKARSTTSAPEQEALVLRAYVQMAAFLNSFPPDPPGAGRRRERRHLRDRRAAAENHGTAAADPQPHRVGRAAAVYQQSGASPGRLDLTL
jgi:hypothetical protein